MRVYTRRESNPLKWVIAAILFIAVLTFTMSEVNGYPAYQKPGDQKHSDDGSSVSKPDNPDNGSNYRAPENGTSVVPEPGTLLLMATGIGAIYIFRKSRRTTA